MRNLFLIYIAMVLGLLFFAVLSFVKGDDPVIGFLTRGDPWVYIVPIIAMTSYFGGDLIFKKQLLNIQKTGDLRQMLLSYQQAAIIRYAILEGAALIAILAYRENNNTFYLVITVSLILYLLKLWPTQEKAVRDLGLKGKDREHFQNGKEEIS